MVAARQQTPRQQTGSYVGLSTSKYDKLSDLTKNKSKLSTNRSKHNRSKLTKNRSKLTERIHTETMDQHSREPNTGPSDSPLTSDEDWRHGRTDWPVRFAGRCGQRGVDTED